MKTATGARTAAKAGATRTAKAAKPVPRRGKVLTPGDPVASALATLNAEVAALKAGLLRPPEPPAGSSDELDAVRRTVNELLDRRMDAVIRDIVAIRQEAGALQGAEALVGALDALLVRLGAVPFQAQRFDHVDPLIHAVSRETHDADLPDGVISAALRPGFRTLRGVVVARAQVAVNRRT